MRPKDIPLAKQLDGNIRFFENQTSPLPGIQDQKRRDVLLEQLVESIHRIEYIKFICPRQHGAYFIDPSNNFFDPYKAALICQQRGDIDEAFWLVFLSVHFGKHKNAKWQTLRDVYGELGSGNLWDWQRTSQNTAAFRQWLAANQGNIASYFGNHRKYQSLDANKPVGTGAAFESYVNWIGPSRSHQGVIARAHNDVGQNHRKIFHYLYKSMDAVTSFGRTAKFDYLTMLGKLGLAPIEPGSTYMTGATGPVTGARMLFGGNKNAKRLDSLLVDLEAGLNLSFGMQVLEDALCNWQKSPGKFKAFRG